MNKEQMEYEKNLVPYYTCPREEAGEVLTVDTSSMTPEEFTAVRETVNRLFIEGDLSKYFSDPDDEPEFVCAAVGASAIPSIMGTNEYSESTMMDLFQEKLGAKKKVITPELQRIFDAGHFNEYLIAKEFCRRNRLTLLRPRGQYQLLENKALFCNVDYYASDEADNIYILEIKNPNGREHQKEVHRRYDEELPAEQMYVDQVLYQMHISGVHRGFVVYGWAGSIWAREEQEIDSVYGFPVFYDQERIDLEVKSATIFAHALVEVDEKKLLALPGATPKDFTIVYGEGEGELVSDDKEWQDLCDEYDSAQRAIDLAKERQAETEKKLRALLDDKRSALIHNARFDVEITTKKRESKTWDLEALKAVQPEIYAEGISFSITDARLKKLDEVTKKDVLSCLTTEVKAVPGINIKFKKKK